MNEPDGRPANRLASETSAYLRQHMHNPVDWYPWGDEAFAHAREQDRPVLVSIGYSACHWCHVMERESFEDPDTAALMNQWFVCIKVDREERPDVDQIYMDTVMRLTGHGGWPLTVFCTPDGHPFYAGTYFPDERRHNMPSFREVLAALNDAWRGRRDEVEKSAREILASLDARPTGVAESLPGAAQVRAAAEQLMQGADRENGGFGTAPKFPTPTNLELLLCALDTLEPERAEPVLDFVVHTCHEMARRGLYDHLGGGFHRYCVDARWGIPHFEKMLYDQGLLVRVYADVARRLALRAGGGAEPSSVDPDLVWPIQETVAWLRREMRGEEGAFFASQDADSEGEEGRFYVWTPAQLADALGGERAAAFAEAYGVTDTGNFEHGTTHLHDLARRPRAQFEEERAVLRAVREGRVPPGTDRKRVCSWNGYAIAGLAFAASLLDDERMLADAVVAARFVSTGMRDERGRLLRVHNEGRSHVGAFLDDHAALLDACLALHRAGAGPQWLGSAAELADAIATRFFDEGEGDFFLTPEDGERLPHRPRSDHDGATPHATGLAALGLLRVAELAGRRDLRRVVERVLRSHAFVLERAPAGFPTLVRAAVLSERGPSVAVVVGEPDAPETVALARRARIVLGPEDAVVVAAPGEWPTALDPAWLRGREPQGGRPTAWVCRGVECSLPVTDPADLGLV